MSHESSAVDTQESTVHIAGLVLVAGLSHPHESYYRPAIREKCFDGALPIADNLITIYSLSDIESLTIDSLINDLLVDRIFPRDCISANNMGDGICIALTKQGNFCYCQCFTQF